MSGTSENPRFGDPEIKLEDVRRGIGTNTCYGRGRKTAAARGYNAERLAYAVLDGHGVFIRVSQKSWIDTIAEPNMNQPGYNVEAKCCVDRYQKQDGGQGRYGMFKIWKPHHDKLLNDTKLAVADPIYFFVVYTVKSRVEKEVGKLIAPAEMIDSVLDNWSSEEHVTMGAKKSRNISWRLLLKRLGVSRQRFQEANMIDLTNE
jgi:hypothetical protein